LKKKAKNERDLSPPPDTKVHFKAATAFVRDAKIHNHKKPTRFTSSHRGIRVTLDIGYVLVERRWFSSKK
jgi:hypothetical protein